MIKAYTNFSAKAARVRGYLSADKVTSEDFPTYFQKALTLYYPLFLDLRVLQENMDSFYAAARKVKKRYPRSVSKQELIKQVGELWSRAWEGESEMYYTVCQRVFSSSAMQRKYETGYQGLQWEHGKLGTEEEYFARTIFYHQYAASYLEILRKICPQHIFSKIFLRGFASETQMSRAGAQCRKFFTFLDIIRELGLWSETVNDYLFLVRYWQEHRYHRIQEIDDLLRSRAKASQLRFTISESSVVSDFSAHFLGAGQYAFLTERVRNFELTNEELGVMDIKGSATIDGQVYEISKIPGFSLKTESVQSRVEEQSLVTEIPIRIDGKLLDGQEAEAKRTEKIRKIERILTREVVDFGTDERRQEIANGIKKVESDGIIN